MYVASFDLTYQVNTYQDLDYVQCTYVSISVCTYYVVELTNYFYA